MVIFLFLQNVSATVIPSLALPLSIVGTFAVMYVFDYSLDNLSLMALTLSVGFVVDDAIVMLENIVRHMEMGEKPMEAALDGSKEIGFTIISMTISLAAVFIPNEDASEVRISLEAAQGISYPDLVRHQRAAMEIIEHGPNVATFFSFVGGGRGAGNSGTISLRLKPKSERLPIDKVMDELRP